MTSREGAWENAPQEGRRLGKEEFLRRARLEQHNSVMEKWRGEAATFAAANPRFAALASIAPSQPAPATGAAPAPAAALSKH